MRMRKGRYRRGESPPHPDPLPPPGEGTLRVPRASPRRGERDRVRGAAAHPTIARISLRFAHSRFRFLHSQPNAGRELRSTVRHAPSDDEVAREGRNERPNELARRLVVDPQEEPVLDRVQVGEGGHLSPALGHVASPVVRHGRRDVERPPAEPAQPPREVRVLAVQEEVRIEVAGRDLRALERGAAVEPGRPRSSEDLLLPAVASRRRLAGAAVEVAARGGEVDPGRVEKAVVREPDAVAPQEPPRGRADVRGVLRVEPPRQDRGEVGLEPAVRIQGEDVTARRGVDPGVHRRGETRRSRAGPEPARPARGSARPRATRRPKRCRRGATSQATPAARAPSRARPAGPRRPPWTRRRSKRRARSHAASSPRASLSTRK